MSNVVTSVDPKNAPSRSVCLLLAVAPAPIVFGASFLIALVRDGIAGPGYIEPEDRSFYVSLATWTWIFVPAVVIGLLLIAAMCAARRSTKFAVIVFVLLFAQWLLVLLAFYSPKEWMSVVPQL